MQPSLHFCWFVQCSEIGKLCSLSIENDDVMGKTSGIINQNAQVNFIMEKGKGARLSFTTTLLQLFSFSASLTALVAWMLFQIIMTIMKCLWFLVQSSFFFYSFKWGENTKSILIFWNLVATEATCCTLFLQIYQDISKIKSEKSKPPKRPKLNITSF